MASKAASTVDMVQWLLGLSIVLGLLFFCLWLLRRYGHFSRLPPGQFRVLAAISLGGRERAVLVQAGRRQLVLGVAPGQVRTLCVLEGEERIPVEAAGREISFAEMLAEARPGDGKVSSSLHVHIPHE